MRKIGIRQFQQSFHKELKQLPFIVTKDGNDYCVVTPLTAINDIAKMLRSDDVTTPVTTMEGKEVVTWTTEAPEPPTFDDEADTRETGKCEAPNSNCKNEGYPYQVTFMTDEGEKKKQVFLCGFHVKKTRDSGQEVVEV